MRRTKIVAIALGLAAFVGATAEGCPDSPPPPSVGHDPNRAGVPDPAPHTSPTTAPVRLKFAVVNEVTVVVTWNAGRGNKFIDALRPHGDSWYASAPKGASIYLGAIAAHKGSRGTITVKVVNADNGKLICVDSNWGSEQSGSSCQGKAK